MQILSRPHAVQSDVTADEVLKPAAIAGGIATVTSGVFHRYGLKPLFGQPNLAGGTAALRLATLGVGAMSAVAAGAVAYTGKGGERSNNILESTALSTAAFGAFGIWVHGKQNPVSGVPVNRLTSALGVAGTGALVGALLLHPFISGGD